MLFKSALMLPVQNPHIEARREETDGPMEATTAMAGLDTPASRDAMGALADALEDAAKEVRRLEVGPQGP